jgi:FkbM family methyltransferase
MDDFVQIVFRENGKTYKLAMHNLIQTYPIAFNMRYSVQKYLRFVAAPRKIEYIVDVGACIGAFAIPYTRIFPDADILCLEPSKHNFPFLQYNTKRFPNIESIKIAAHKKSEVVRIALPTMVQRSGVDSSCDTGMISVYGEDTQYAESVSGHRLDDIITRPVDWLKIDVEGHEVNVLRGAKRILSQDRPILQVEVKNENQQMAGFSPAILMLEIFKHNYTPIGSIRGDMLFRPAKDQYEPILSVT